jgi:uncharacterized protein (TIGR02266 family)
MTKKTSTKTSKTKAAKSERIAKTIPFKAKKPKAKAKKADSEKKGAERRVGERIPVKMLVDYKSEGNYLFDFSYNLGTGGIFIHTQSILPRGSVVVMNFTLPETGEKFEIKGKVMWTQEVAPEAEASTGMGVQFMDLSEKQRRVLADYVQQFTDTYQNPLAAV